MPRKICFVFTLLLLIMVLACGTQEQVPSEDESSESPVAGGTYAKYIFYDAKPIDIPPEELDRIRREQEEQQSMVDSTHLLNLDTTRSEGAPYLDFHWLWEGSAKGYAEAEHTHDFDEFIGFIGVGTQDNPYDLDSEIEVWLGFFIFFGAEVRRFVLLRPDEGAADGDGVGQGEYGERTIEQRTEDEAEKNEDAGGGGHKILSAIENQ